MTMTRRDWATLALLVACTAPLSTGCQDTIDSLHEVVSPSEAAPNVPGSVAGRWGTQWGSQVCNLVLTQNGTQVTGRYTSVGAPPGTVQGTLNAGVLTGTWSDEGGGGGGIVLTFTPDTQRFTGTWGSGASSTNGGSWTGTR